jgi:hypothetical protein
MKLFCLVFTLLMVTSIGAQDTITKKDISAAARLMDLQYSDKEVDTMYEGVKENLLLFKASSTIKQ